MYVYGGNIKRYLTEVEVVVYGSEWRLWARHFEHWNENSGYIKCWEFLVQAIGFTSRTSLHGVFR